jgi:hypothetical protein
MAAVVDTPGGSARPIRTRLGAVHTIGVAASAFMSNEAESQAISAAKHTVTRTMSIRRRTAARQASLAAPGKWGQDMRSLQ